MVMDSEEQVKTHILCYGDSNTWGFVPGLEGNRFAPNVRWPGVLSKLLRTNYRITEEGLNGRTTLWDDPFAPGIERNGLKLAGTILESHKPVDLMIIFLGTNDLKPAFSVGAYEIAQGVEQIARAAARPEFGPGGTTPPALLVIVPLSIWEVAIGWGPVFKGGREKSLGLLDAFHQMSKRTNVPIIIAEDIIHSDPVDGIHLSAESHAILGQQVAKWVLEWSDNKNR